MKYVALNVPGTTEFICNGTPTYCITNFSFQAKDVPYDRTFYLEDDLVRHVYNNISLSNLDKILTTYFGRINILYSMSENIVRRSSRSKDFNYVNPFCKMGSSKIKPTVMYKSPHYYEYDIHSAFTSLLMFKYYLSDTDDGHVTLPDCVNPLKDVKYVRYKGNTLTICDKDSDGMKYLCSRLMNNSKEYQSVLMMCKILITDCWNRFYIDCSHLVYSIVISQTLKSLYSKQKESLINLYHTLVQLSSIKYVTDNIKDKNIINYYADAVIVRKPMEPSPEPPEKIVGERYYKFRSNNILNNTGMHWESLPVVTDIHKVTSYGFGWASFDISHITDRDIENKVMYHVDIKDAYPSRLFNYVGEHIDKRRFGTVKCTDSRLYQRIRLEVSDISREIFRRVGEENVVYWKTDGGIVLIDKSIDIYALLSGTSLLHIDRVISSKVVKLPDWIDLPKSVTGHAYTSRVWAYNVKTDSSSNLHWANNYEDKIPEIFKHNNMEVPKEYTPLDIYEEFLKNG